MIGMTVSGKIGTMAEGMDHDQREELEGILKETADDILADPLEKEGGEETFRRWNNPSSRLNRQRRITNFLYDEADKVNRELIVTSSVLHPFTHYRLTIEHLLLHRLYMRESNKEIRMLRDE